MRKTKLRLGVGIPTAIFIILTLTLLLFSVLSFLDGSSDLRLTERAAEMAEGYYTAVAESERALHALRYALAAENALTETIVQNAGGTMKDGDTCELIFDAGAGRTLVLTIGGLEARTPGVLSRELITAPEQTEEAPLSLYIG